MHSINYSVLSGLNLLNVEDRVAQLRLNHVFDIYQGKLHLILVNIFYWDLKHLVVTPDQVRI